MIRRRKMRRMRENVMQSRSESECGRELQNNEVKPMHIAPVDQFDEAPSHFFLFSSVIFVLLYTASSTMTAALFYGFHSSHPLPQQSEGPMGLPLPHSDRPGRDCNGGCPSTDLDTSCTRSGPHSRATVTATPAATSTEPEAPPT